MKAFLKELFYSTISVLIISIYGGEVCPFLEDLGTGKLFGILFSSSLINFSILFVIKKLYWGRTHKEISALKIFAIGIISRTMVGMISGTWNFLIYDFPIGSGIKLVLGFFILSFFSTLFINLDKEYFLLKNIKTSPHYKNKFSHLKKTSLTSKSFGFLSFLSFGITAVILLLVYKDLNFIVKNIELVEFFKDRPEIMNLKKIIVEIFIEISFVFICFLIFSLFLIKKYIRNINISFQSIMEAYEEVKNGNLQHQIPVLRGDEIGHISNETNNLIHSLSEKERIQSVLGKFVNSKVSKMVLEKKEHTILENSSINVAIVYGDIRSFTPLCEKYSDDCIINMLNTYFSLVTKKVHKNGGIIDKFIGDAFLAVFGVDDESQKEACHAAYTTGLEIQEALTNELKRYLDKENLPLINIGMSFHYGPVVAGTVGSSDRLEYTVIGDSVNIAARLESFTKDIGSSLIFSETFYQGLGPKYRSNLQDLGQQKLKGKNQKIRIYGMAS